MPDMDLDIELAKIGQRQSKELKREMRHNGLSFASPWYDVAEQMISL